MQKLSCALLMLFLPTLLLAHEYFPWSEGDYATYTSLNHNKTYESTVTRTSQAWRRVSNFAGLGEQWVYAGDTTGIYIYRNGTYTQLPDHTFDVGSSTTANLGECHDNVTITLFAKHDRYALNTGEFNDVIELHVSDSACQDAGVTKIWLAKGVGVIAWQSMTIAGPDLASLSKARIGEREYPLQQGITVSANLPGPALDWKPNLNLYTSVKVTNNNSEAITLSFSSGKAFDIALINTATGRVVQRASEGKFYTQAFQFEEIEPGQSSYFAGEMLLKDGIEPGAYILQVEVTTHEQPHIISAPLTLR